MAAGQPILAEENIETYFPLPADILPNTEIYMLNVRGESMINAGILDGDQVIVSKTETARNGEIVAVSEGYKAKPSCLNGIESIKKNAPEAEAVKE